MSGYDWEVERCQGFEKRVSFLFLSFFASSLLRETKGDGDLKGDSVVSAPLVDETATALSEGLGDEGKQRPFHRWLSSTKENADLSLYQWLSETGNNGVACG